MTLNQLIGRTERTLRQNSPTILTGLGVAGTLTTAYLAGVASFKAARVIDKDEEQNGRIEDQKARAKRRFSLVWKLYVPPTLSGAASIACIVGASSVNAKRTAAAATAYTLTERAFSEYREKVIEQIGENKEQKVRDAVATDRVLGNPVESSEVLVTGNGDVLCCELYTKRYFKSDMETLRKAQNDINARVLQELYVTLSDFYYLISLPATEQSTKVGWNSDRLMELQFTAVVTEDGRPCLAFDYNYVKPV